MQCFGGKNGFSAKLKNGCFSVFPAATRSVVNVGHFLVAMTAPPSFVDHSPKLRVLEGNSDWHWLEITEIWDEPRKTTPTSETKPRPIRASPVNIFNMKQVSNQFRDMRVPKVLLLP